MVTKIVANIVAKIVATIVAKIVANIVVNLRQGSSFVMEGVKNLAVKKHNLPVTRIVDALMELKSSPEVDDYRYFDPKLVRATDNAAIPRSRSPFQVCRLPLL